MPIRINLLAEAQAAEEMRRRDPVKRAIYVAVFLLVLALAWCSSLFLQSMVIKNSFTRVQEEIQSHTNDYNTVSASLKRITDARQKLEALEKLSASRFLQGNLLNALQQSMVPNVQLTRLRVDQGYLYAEGTPTKTNGTHVIMGKAPVATEKITVALDARDTSTNPGDQVNKFKESVAKQAYFKLVLDRTNGIRLSNLSAPQNGIDGKLCVLFTLECRYPDHSQ